MSPHIIFYIGVIICCIALISAITGLVILHLSKVKLNKYLDFEYGKRRN